MNKDAAGQTSLKGIIQTLSPTELEILQGVVISEAPLRIQMLNDNKHVITENLIIVPRHLTDYHTVVDIELAEGRIDSNTTTSGGHTHPYSGTTDPDGDPIHTHYYSGTTQSSSHSHDMDDFNIYRANMTVYNALKEGETVHILSLNGGKRYYVLDRI